MSSNCVTIKDLNDLLVQSANDEKSESFFHEMESMGNERDLSRFVKGEAHPSRDMNAIFKRIQDEKLEQGTAYEKVHGCNMSLEVFLKQGKITCVKLYKRTQPIEKEKDLFAGCINIWAQHKDQILKLAERVYNKWQPSSFLVYGEYYTKGMHGSSEVNYHIARHLLLFRLLVDGKHVSHTVFIPLFTESGFDTPAPLFKGSLLDFCKFAAGDMNTVISPLALKNNKEATSIIEGAVFHFDNLITLNKSKDELLFKYRTTSFQERANAKPVKEEKKKEEDNDPYLDKEALKTRIDHYLSNHGESSKDDIGSFIRGVVEDLAKDLKKDGYKEKKIKDIRKKASSIVGSLCRSSR
jgi:hypothetical protein